jgi:hypothetical protein
MLTVVVEKGPERKHEGHNGGLGTEEDGSWTPHFADSLLISYSGAVQVKPPPVKREAG